MVNDRDVAGHSRLTSSFVLRPSRARADDLRHRRLRGRRGHALDGLMRATAIARDELSGHAAAAAVHERVTRP